MSNPNSEPAPERCRPRNGVLTALIQLLFGEGGAEPVPGTEPRAGGWNPPPRPAPPSPAPGPAAANSAWDRTGRKEPLGEGNKTKSKAKPNQTISLQCSNLHLLSQVFYRDKHVMGETSQLETQECWRLFENKKREEKCA